MEEVFTSFNDRKLLKHFVKSHAVKTFKYYHKNIRKNAKYEYSMQQIPCMAVKRTGAD